MSHEERVAVDSNFFEAEVNDPKLPRVFWLFLKAMPERPILRKMQREGTQTLALMEQNYLRRIWVYGQTIETESRIIRMTVLGFKVLGYTDDCGSKKLSNKGAWTEPCETLTVGSVGSEQAV